VNTATGSAIREVTIDFGDGDRQNLGAITGPATVAHTYSDPGTFTVVATATDITGERTTATTTIVVASPPPLIVQLNLQDSGSVNTPVSFRVTVTGDTTPSRILRYEWDFGDGTPIVSLNSPATSHAYTTQGVKVVRVTVVTRDGERLTAQEEIFITPIQ
jgi:PKD repeat protein